MGRRRASARDAAMEFSQIPGRTRRPYRCGLFDRHRADGRARHQCDRSGGFETRPSPRGINRCCPQGGVQTRPSITPKMEDNVMNVHARLASDIEGLTHQVDPLSRRGFFLAASAAAAAGYTLAAGPVRADAIHTDSNGLTAGDAKVKVADGEMPVYYARPANLANPPIILVAMEIFGLHEYIRDVARRLGKLGALAVAPDYYFRKGVDLTKITDIPQLMPLVNSKPDAELLSDLDATVAWAKSQGGDANRLGIKIR